MNDSSTRIFIAVYITFSVIAKDWKQLKHPSIEDNEPYNNICSQCPLQVFPKNEAAFPRLIWDGLLEKMLTEKSKFQGQVVYMNTCLLKLQFPVP